MGTRNCNHEGSVYKDKQGRWRALVSLPSVDGKYKKSTYTVNLVKRLQRK